MELKPGSRWRSSVGEGEVVIVRPPKAAAKLENGGHPMIASGTAQPAGLAMAAEHSGGIQAGKRYVDEETGLEVLCSKAGPGSLSLDGRALQLKEAKKLPSSD